MVAAALCYAGLILTHNLSAYIYTGVLIVYCAFLLLRGIVERQWGLLGAVRPAALLLSATLLAYALTAYLSMPAILEKSCIQLEGLLYVSHADHFPSLKDIMPNRVIHIYGIIFPESPEYAYKMGLVQVVLGGLGRTGGAGLLQAVPVPGTRRGRDLGGSVRGGVLVHPAAVAVGLGHDSRCCRSRSSRGGSCC